jgi:hypothetical protein
VGTIVCNSCNSATPYGYWVKDHDHVGKLLCQLCHKSKFPKSSDLIVPTTFPCTYCPEFNPSCDSCNANKLKAEPVKCNNCNRDCFTTYCFQDPIIYRKIVCFECYMKKSKARVEILPDGSLIVRTCTVCRSGKSTSWYKDGIGGSYICKQCYNHRYQSKIEILPNGSIQQRVCSACHTTKTPAWAKHISSGALYLCKKCYSPLDPNFIPVDPEIIVPNRLCALCAVSSSPRWFKDHQILGAYICVGCYNKS